MKYCRIVFSFIALVFWILLMLVIFCGVRWFFSQKLAKFFQVFHRGCCWVFSLRCHVVGRCSEKQPTLFLSNHISYLDVFVLGSVIPGYFIAKSEVASWPVLGWLAKVQNTLFFERSSQRVRGQLSVMSSHFDNGGNLILFPEGTSTEGTYVEPFKSSLLQSIEKSQREVIIQPVTIAYTDYCDKPMTKATRDRYAWYGDMPFASHFFGAMGMKTADVRIVFHQPVLLNDFETRKNCAHHCYQVVSRGLGDCLSREADMTI